ncbi:MFS transporter [Paracoccaceae bacterium]|nr:MFS transporter [Paracoccaceae bacterium]
MNKTTHYYPDSFYSLTRLIITLFIAIVGNAGMWAIVVIMPNLGEEFQVTRSVLSIPYTLTMLGFALGNVFLGQIVDRFGITKAIVLASLLNAFGYVCASIFDSFFALAFFHLFIGLGTAVSFGPLLADISLWFKKYRGIAVAITASGNYISGAIFPILLGGLISDYGWRISYFLLALSCIIIILPASFFLRRCLDKKFSDEQEKLATAMSTASRFKPLMLQIILSIAGICCCVAMSMPQIHLVTMCVDLGYGSQVGAEMLSLMLLGGVISRLISGVLVDFIGGVKTLLLGSSLQCIGLVMYYPTTDMSSLYIVSLIFGLSQGGIVPSYAIIVREYMPPQEAGARVGIVIMATVIGMAFGGWISGVIFDATNSYQLAILNGIMWNLINILIVGSLLFFGTAQPLTRKTA